MSSICWSLSSYHIAAIRIFSCASSSSTAHHHHQQIGIKIVSSSIYIYTCRVYLDQTSIMQTIADCHHNFIIITSSLYHCRCMCYYIIIQWLGFASQIDRASSLSSRCLLSQSLSRSICILIHPSQYCQGDTYHCDTYINVKVTYIIGIIVNVIYHISLSL